MGGKLAVALLFGLQILLFGPVGHAEFVNHHVSTASFTATEARVQ